MPTFCTVCVDTVCQTAEAFDRAVIKKLRSGGKAADRGNVAQNHIPDAAFGETGVKCKALFTDDAVTLFVSGGKRQEHNAVFQGEIADFDWLCQFQIHFYNLP